MVRWWCCKGPGEQAARTMDSARWGAAAGGAARGEAASAAAAAANTPPAAHQRARTWGGRPSSVATSALAERQSRPPSAGRSRRSRRERAAADSASSYGRWMQRAHQKWLWRGGEAAAGRVGARVACQQRASTEQHAARAAGLTRRRGQLAGRRVGRTGLPALGSGACRSRTCVGVGRVPHARCGTATAARGGGWTCARPPPRAHHRCTVSSLRAIAVALAVLLSTWGGDKRGGGGKSAALTAARGHASRPAHPRVAPPLPGEPSRHTHAPSAPRPGTPATSADASGEWAPPATGRARGARVAGGAWSGNC